MRVELGSLPLARFNPVLHPELGAEAVAAVAGLVVGEPPRIFAALGRHHRLFRAWLPFGGWLLLRTDLPRADVELVILRAAHGAAAPYEWVQHASLARRAGLTAEDVARVVEGPEADGWTARQRLLLHATDELHDRRVLTDATRDALADELSPNELIELCFLVGHYDMLAMALNTLAVEPEATARRRLDGAAAAVADRLARTLDRRRRPPAARGRR